jgi:release factor glutamine methyltransferase
MKTLLEVLTSGTEYLEKQGCDDARSTMQHLMAHVLQCNRTFLYSNFDRPMAEAELAQLRDIIKRKAQGIPLQHLLGTTEFFRREFLTDHRALIPRPETEELVEFVLKYTTGTDLRVLDMGTGSGIIGITLALELGARAKEVVLADLMQPALDLALENAMRLGASVSTIQTDLFSEFRHRREQESLKATALLDDSAQADTSLSSDELEEQKVAEEMQPVAPSDTFDLIVANLPYIPDGEDLQEEVKHDPASALFGGPKGWEIIERFLTEAPDFLNPDGMVALEVGYDQGDLVVGMMQKLGYRSTAVLRDLNGIARFPMGHCPKK